MKKSYWIFLIIGVILIGGGLVYYYLLYQPEVRSVTISSFNITKKNDNKGNIIEKINEKTNSINVIEGNIKDTEEENNTDINSAKEIYSYRKTFRNPFADYRTVTKVFGRKNDLPAEEGKIAEIKVDKNNKADQFKAAKLKSIIPFRLKGIIGSDKGWLAIIETKDGSKIMRERDLIEDFEIIDIVKDKLIVSYKEMNFKIEMGRGSGGS